jgi:hypothetical protein
MACVSFEKLTQIMELNKIKNAWIYTSTPCAFILQYICELGAAYFLLYCAKCCDVMVYLAVPKFESRRTDRLSCLRLFVVFLRPSMQTLRCYLKICYDRFLFYPSQIHHS